LGRAGPDDEATYRRLVDNLRGDAHVATTQVWFHLPEVKQALTSTDNKGGLAHAGQSHRNHGHRREDRQGKASRASRQRMTSLGMAIR